MRNPDAVVPMRLNTECKSSDSRPPPAEKLPDPLHPLSTTRNQSLKSSRYIHVSIAIVGDDVFFARLLLSMSISLRGSLNTRTNVADPSFPGFSMLTHIALRSSRARLHRQTSDISFLSLAQGKPPSKGSIQVRTDVLLCSSTLYFRLYIFECIRAPEGGVPLVNSQLRLKQLPRTTQRLTKDQLRAHSYRKNVR